MINKCSTVSHGLVQARRFIEPQGDQLKEAKFSSLTNVNIAAAHACLTELHAEQQFKLTKFNQ